MSPDITNVPGEPLIWGEGPLVLSRPQQLGATALRCGRGVLVTSPCGPTDEQAGWELPTMKPTAVSSHGRQGRGCPSPPFPLQNVIT